ncbi:conserved protein of unknown function [Petrocella atlantisensis]|uniref:DUF4330 domain-containing protein n=1 Tax=Petrocella atlantisensis TaxID=2173034 RepID=A0A3P7S3Z1_9FIRM|nr:DUF4330 domain-containing protein [Petrocella atlantisensis]PKM54376.1 MAG: hypothetical protein CVV00_08480 [Firmicutes bacterium HGW-Firmicutes-5]VDN47359.1 conserved protein of unknown function [Petrocella atlantisensis]
MKLITREGKLFNKIHIFDLLFLMLLIVVLLGAISKFSGKNIINLTTNTENVMVEFTVETYPFQEDYFASIKVGDKLAEDKKYINGTVTDVQIIDNILALPDNNGQMVTESDPYKKKALVTSRVEMSYKDPVYKMGKEEMVVGNIFYFTTEKVKLSSVIVDFKIVK